MKPSDSSRRLAVVSSENQHRQLKLRLTKELNDFQIFCDNASFEPLLRSAGVAFKSLDEFLIKEKWDAINAWGCGRAASWIAEARAAKHFSGIDWPSVLYLFFSHLLAHLLKNREYAKLCLEKENPSEVLVFDGHPQKPFPGFSGNAYLNHFLEKEAAARGCAVLRATAEEAASPISDLLGRSSWKKWAKDALATFQRTAKPGSGPVDIVACGSLKHLGPAIEALLKENLRVGIHDFEYHPDQASFAGRRGISYLVAATKQEEDADFSSMHLPAIRSSLRKMGEKGHFRHEGDDLWPLVEKLILPTLEPFLGGCSARAKDYEELIETLSPRALLTDEDYALRGGFLAAYARCRGLQVFCISHALVSYDFGVKPEERAVGQGTTFVQSEFEKTAYANRGWNPDFLCATGIPRFDALQRRSRRSVGGKPLKLLYCANTFVSMPHTPDNHGYLGASIHSFESTVRRTAEMLFEASKELPVEITIKLHNIEGLEGWRRFLKEIGPSTRHRLIEDPNADFIDLLSASEAMILSYRSTALAEAALLNVPSFYVDVHKTAGEAFKEFGKKGLCRIVTEPGELRSGFQALLAGSSAQSLSGKDREWVLGREDGRASARVAAEIKRQLAGTAAAYPKRMETHV